MNENRSIHVKRSVRPIRLAFLVRPDDKKNLKRIFEINTCIWGGRYNGIVPIFPRTPKWWGDKILPGPNSKTILQGYVEAFEPDFLVTTHRDFAKDCGVDTNRILSMDDILQKDAYQHINYGLSVNAIYRAQYEKQFKFKQRYPIEALLPTIEGANSLFGSAAFGSFPSNEKLDYFLGNYKTVFEPKEIVVSGENLLSSLCAPIFPVRVGSSMIEITKRPWSNGPTLFFMDTNEPSDIIDYWNLRALGWRILPVPKVWASSMKDQCRHFAEKNYTPVPGNPNGLMRETRVLKSRRISDKEFNEFVAAIHPGQKFSILQQFWYPRIWDSWARDTDQADRCHISNTEGELECPVNEGMAIFPPLCPSFDLSGSHSHGPRWANVIKLDDYGHRGERSLVFPKMKNFEKLLETSPLRRTFGDSEGVVHLVEYEKVNLYWKLPSGFSIFQTWFEEMNFKAELSGAGKTAQQVITALNGPNGVRHIAHPDIIGLLDKMAHGLVETPSDEQPNKKKPPARTRMESRRTWWTLLQKVHRGHRQMAEYHLDALCSKGVLKLGLRVKCTTCDQQNWYALDNISEKLKCERCLNTYGFPVSRPPEGDWHYRTQGAFSVENFAQGAYSVALSLRFLISTVEATATWTSSLDITTADGSELECDFAVLRNSSQVGKAKTTLVFGECKSFDEFEAIDITRMKNLAKEFPGSILVFSKLKNTLNKKETSRLMKLVRWGRKSIGGDKLQARVLILTGHELFSNMRPPACWKDLEGKYKQFVNDNRLYGGDLDELCDVTNQIHLGIESYSQWVNDKIGRRRQGRIRRGSQKRIVTLISP